MPLHRVFALLGLATALAVAGCKGQKGAAPPPPPPRVTVARPATAPVRDYWEYNGYLDTTESVEVRARVKGYLTKVAFKEGTEVKGPVRGSNGEVVTPGEVLYLIDKREYLTAKSKAEADLAKANADIEKAKADIQNWDAQIELAKVELKRADESVAKSVGSKTDQDKAKANLDVTTAQAAAARAQKDATVGARDSAAAALHSTEIQLGYTEVRAQISGLISRTQVTEGNLVGQTDPTLLTTIVRVDELYVYFDAPEGDLIAYQRAAAASTRPDPTSRSIDVEVRVAGEEGYPHKGKIDFRENRVETSTGTVRIRGRVSNPPGANGVRLLYPGLFARVRVPSGDEKPHLVIPEDAIMTGQEGQFVYVIGANDVVEKRIVTLGRTPVWKAPAAANGNAAPGWVIENPKPPPAPEKGPPLPARRPVRSVVAVLSGLKPEDRVIVDGTQKARPGAPVTPEDWVMLAPK